MSNFIKPCLHSGRYSFDPMFMNLCQNVFVTIKKGQIESGSCWVKN